MKISEVIELLKKCDENEELILGTNSDGVFILNDEIVECNECDGNGSAVYEHNAARIGYDSNGEYCEPDFIEETCVCRKCFGEGIVRRENEFENISLGTPL